MAPPVCRSFVYAHCKHRQFWNGFNDQTLFIPGMVKNGFMTENCRKMKTGKLVRELLLVQVYFKTNA